MYKNAAKGIKKIFTSEILGLVTAVLAIALAISVVVFAGSLVDALTKDLADGSGVLTGGVLTVVFSAAIAIISLIAFILKLVGIINARNDDPAFGSAFIFTLVGLGASFIAGIFSGNQVVNGIFTTISNIASFLITLFIIKGIINIGKKLGKYELVQKGNTIFNLIMLVYGLSIVGTLISTIFKNIPALVTVGGILGIIAGVISIIYYFLYLSLLNKARKTIA